MVTINGVQFTEAELLYIDFQKGKAGSFSTHLFHAIGAADLVNRERCRAAFPDETAAHEAWTEGNLYDRAGIAGLITWDTEKKHGKRK